ncbi:MAG TPA: hypothetical protein VFP84_38575 [Kofleriaceae bacterium]|nr:hypothetical protein [Kofleriaceae bacterium]
MAGIRSIGWWVPPGRRTAAELEHAYGLCAGALTELGVVATAAAGPDDHPSTMAARATHHALAAAGLEPRDLDLVIFTGVTKDWPPPWVAAYGVLDALGAPGAAGFDLGDRCAGVLDALWLAKLLVEAGGHRHVAVCCAERFDHWLGPARPLETVGDAMYGAGAAAAIVSSGAGNDIAALATWVSRDLSAHHAAGPRAGGTRVPLDRAAFDADQHQWRSQLTMRDSQRIAEFSADADRHTFPEVCRRAGFEAVDFVACSPFYPEPQLRVLAELGIPREATLFTIPQLGHLGGSDLLLGLAIATAIDHPIGRRVVSSLRTNVAGTALAIRAHGPSPAIAVAGEGIDLTAWRAARSAA